MLQIYYLHCKDIEGTKRTYESFDYEELIPVNSEKPTEGLFLLGLTRVLANTIFM